MIETTLSSRWAELTDAWRRTGLNAIRGSDVYVEANEFSLYEMSEPKKLRLRSLDAL